MIAKTLGAAAVLALAGTASAQFLSQTSSSKDVKGYDSSVDTVMARGLIASSFSVDISGITSNDPLGALGNNFLLIDVAAAAGKPAGTNMTMMGIGWNVFQSSIGASWGQEMLMHFSDSTQSVGGQTFDLRPSVTGAPIVGIENNTSGGLVDLTSNGLQNIRLPDGILRIEFFETYDDNIGADGLWNAGSTIDIAIPSPGAVGLLGLAGVATLGRKRR